MKLFESPQKSKKENTEPSWLNPKLKIILKATGLLTLFLSINACENPDNNEKPPEKIYTEVLNKKNMLLLSDKSKRVIPITDNENISVKNGTAIAYDKNGQTDITAREDLRAVVALTEGDGSFASAINGPTLSHTAYESNCTAIEPAKCSTKLDKHSEESKNLNVNHSPEKLTKWMSDNDGHLFVEAIRVEKEMNDKNHQRIETKITGIPQQSEKVGLPNLSGYAFESSKKISNSKLDSLTEANQIYMVDDTLNFEMEEGSTDFRPGMNKLLGEITANDSSPKMTLKNEHSKLGLRFGNTLITKMQLLPSNQKDTKRLAIKYYQGNR